MKYILLFFYGLFLFSCSRVELIYDFAPKVTADKIDDAFDFESDRYKEVRAQIKADLATHKKEIVKNLVEVIDVALVISNQEAPGLADFQGLSNIIRSKQKSMVYLFKPSFEKVILNLNEDEVKNIFEFSNKKNSKSDDMLKQKKPFVEKKIEDFDRLMGYLFDAVSNEQETLYAKFIENNLEYFKSQVAARKELTAQFAWPIPSKENLNHYVMKHYAGETSIGTIHYLEQLNILDKNIVRLQYDIWSSLNKKQKDYFKNKFFTLKADLLKLAEK